MKSREFPAEWGGACAACPEHIDRGDLVQYVDDELQHVTCPTVRALAVCPGCFTELPTSGTCGTCE